MQGSLAHSLQVLRGLQHCWNDAVLHAQVTPTNIVYALVDSSDWIQGVELRLCAPCWPTCLDVLSTTHTAISWQH